MDSEVRLVDGRRVRLDHIGIAVESLEEGESFWRLLGLVPSGEDEENPEQGVNIRFLESTADSEPPGLELVDPPGSDTPVGRFIDRRGVGVQQLAFEVEDLSGLLAELKQAGVELIGEEPVPGAAGTRIAFVHPKSTGGVLVELLEKS